MTTFALPKQKPILESALNEAFLEAAEAHMRHSLPGDTSTPYGVLILKLLSILQWKFSGKRNKFTKWAKSIGVSSDDIAYVIQCVNQGDLP